MRIVHAIDSLAVGGAETLLVNYINHYKKAAPDSRHALVILKNSTALHHRIEKDVAHFEIIPFGKASVRSGIRAWKDLIRSFQPQIIHSHLFYPTMLARLGTPKNIPVVSTYHNQSYGKASPYYSPWFGILDRLTFRRNCYRIFVSESVRHCVERATGGTRNGVVIPNFVSDDFYPAWGPHTEKGLRLVAIGSLKKVKNHALLVEALKQIPRTVHVDIYGEGELRESLQHSIDEAGVSVKLWGNEKLSSQLLQNYDAFIMPSLSEGQPVSLLEAMTTGLPSLLSGIPSLRDVAGDAALYFSPEAPGELAAQLGSLLEDKERLQPLSRAALERAAPYSIHNYFRETTKLYGRALCPIR